MICTVCATRLQRAGSLAAPRHSHPVPPRPPPTRRAAAPTRRAAAAHLPCRGRPRAVPPPPTSRAPRSTQGLVCSAVITLSGVICLAPMPVVVASSTSSKLQAHFRKHRRPNQCVRCKWAKQKRSIIKQFPLIQEDWVRQLPAAAATWLGMSWVRVRRRDDDNRLFCFHCVVCEDFHTEFVPLSRLARHHGSRAHQVRVATFLGLSVGPTGRLTCAAPPASEFLVAWKSPMQSGYVEGAGSKSKTKEMQQCIIQAKLRVEHAWLRKIETLALFRDESHGYLLIRAMGCDAQLVSKAFLLGISKDIGGSAFDITQETAAIIERYAATDQDLANAMRQKIEAVCVDSAFNEVKSARLMKTCPRGHPAAPNLKCIVRDRAHASRRVVSRPWRADPFLSDLVDTFIMSRRSIVQRIHRSTVFTAWYVSNLAVHSPEAFAKTGGLGAAKHRFETWQKPISQFVMTLGAVVRTAERILIERAGEDEARDAEAFIHALSEEKCIQLGMLADAADEALLLTRVFDVDPEKLDPSAQAYDVLLFRKRVHTLFGGPRAQCLELTGFTKEVICFLETRAIVIRTGRGGVRSLGGRPVRDEVEPCLVRMRNWLALADMVLAAEFPDCELVDAFNIFHLTQETPTASSMHGDQTQALTEHDKVSIQRLAQAFGVNEERLCTQWRHFSGLARDRFIRSGKCSSREAWRQTIQNKARGVDSEALEKILWRVMGWGVTTSGVERGFVVVRKHLMHRAKASGPTRFMLLKIAEGVPTDERERDHIVGLARELWCTAKPDSISRTGGRRRTGNTARASVKRESRVAWLAERRAAVTQAVSSSSAPLPMAAASSEDVAAALQAEAEFQLDKLKKRKIEALNLGHLTSQELTPALAAEARAQNKRQVKEDRTAENQRLLKARKLNPNGLDRQDLAALQFHVSEGAENDTVNPALLRMHKVSVPMHEADVFVVASLDLRDGHMEHIGNKLQWTAMLLGAYMVLPTFFKGQRACLKFHSAIGFWRAVYISPNFREHHPKMCVLLEAVASRPASKWTICKSSEEFMALRRKKKQKQSQCVVLRRSKGEEVPGIPREVKALDFRGFQRSICKPDATNTVGSFSAG